MDVWPAGLSTGCFYQQSILSCLETIENGGFNSIEVCSTPSHLDYHNSAVVLELGSFGNDWEILERARRGKQYLEDILRRAALSRRGDL